MKQTPAVFAATVAACLAIVCYTVAIVLGKDTAGFLLAILPILFAQLFSAKQADEAKTLSRDVDHRANAIDARLELLCLDTTCPVRKLPDGVKNDPTVSARRVHSAIKDVSGVPRNR